MMRMGGCGVVRLVVALLAGSAAAGKAQAPDQAPAPGPLRPWSLVTAPEFQGPGGLQVLVIEHAEQPVVSVSLVVPAGSRYDPPGKEGVASLTADLLLRGTRTRTAADMAARVGAIGGTLSAATGTDVLTVSATVLAEHAGLVLELLAEVLAGATVPQAEFDSAQRRLVAALGRERDDLASLAQRVFVHALYGDHPYGRQASEESVNALTRADVVSFAATHLRPSRATLVVAGSVRATDVRTLVQRHLSSWRGTAPAEASVARPAPRGTHIVLVHRAGAVQSHIVMGNTALDATDPRHDALAIVNRLLGGSPDARLGHVLGTEKRWAYSAHTEVTRYRDGGHFAAVVTVNEPVTDQALAELGELLDGARSEAPADSEVAVQRNVLVGSYPRQVETPQQLAAQLAQAAVLGLGPEHLRGYRERLAAVTPADVQAAARAAIRPDSAVIVVAGDASKLLDKLRMLAPVAVQDLDGRPLAAEDLGPRAGPLELDRDQLTARRDSFLVLVQGNPLGTFVNETVIDGDSVVYREHLSLPVARWEQETVARLDRATLAMRDMVQTGQSGAQTGETRLTYAGGRVRGTVQIPQGTDTKVTAIDTVAVEGTVDQAVLPLVVPGLALAPNTAYTLNVFDAATASVRPVTATVLAVGNLSVPAGTFPVFQVQVTGSSNAMVLYITRDTPRRVVRVEQMGRPLSFELVKQSPP